MKTKILKADSDILKLEDSPFRQAGGGQPCDYGIIKSNSFEAEVSDITENGLKVKIIKGKPLKGMPVTALVDMKRRKRLSRMHTAEHIFFKSLEKELPEIKLDKINLNEEESLISIYARNLSWDHLFSAEKTANLIINEGRKIIEHNVHKKEANQKFPMLRIKLDRIKEDSVRIIEIKDFDFSACTGTHCAHTGEVKHFLVTRFNSSGADKFEIRFKVDIMEDLYLMSKAARKASSILNTEIADIEDALSSLKESHEKYKKIAREVKANPDKDNIKGIDFLHDVVEMESKALMKQIPEMLKEKSIICIINKTEKSNQIMVGVSDDLDLDAGKIIKKICTTYGGKGGGKNNFAMGAIETDKFNEVFNSVRELI